MANLCFHQVANLWFQSHISGSFFLPEIPCWRRVMGIGLRVLCHQKARDRPLSATSFKILID